MMKWRVQIWSLILVLALGASSTWAQQQKDPRLNPPVAPLPPIMAGESSSKALSDDPVPVPQNALKPDESPLSGAEAFSLGIKSGGRSYVNPSINYMQFADNNRRTATSLDDWRTTGTLTGSLALQQTKSRSQLGINYSGGGLGVAGALPGAGKLGVAQALDQGRERLRPPAKLGNTLILLDIFFAQSGSARPALGN